MYYNPLNQFSNTGHLGYYSFFFYYLKLVVCDKPAITMSLHVDKTIRKKKKEQNLRSFS